MLDDAATVKFPVYNSILSNHGIIYYKSFALKSEYDNNSYYFGVIQIQLPPCGNVHFG